MALVSVIIPVYNRTTLLNEAIRSVIGQSYRPIELVIVDDGSDPPLEAYLEKGFDPTTLNGIVLKYVYQKNKGAGVARQHGLNISNGEFVQYLDSDDTIEPSKIEIQVEQLKADPEAIMAYCTTRLYNLTEQKEIGVLRNSAQRYDYILPQLLITRPWATPSCLWKYPKKDTYWPASRMGEDLLHEFKIGLLNKRIVHCSETLCTVRLHNEGNLRQNQEEDEKMYHAAFANLSEIYTLAITNKGVKDSETKKAIAERLFAYGLKLVNKGYFRNGFSLLIKSMRSYKSIYFKSFFYATLFIFSNLFLKRNMIKFAYTYHRRINPSLKFPHRSV